MKFAFISVFLLATAFTLNAQIDSLNPGIETSCIKNLEVSDRLFEKGDFSQSYFYWRRAFGLCPKTIGSGMYMLGESLLEFRMYETSNKRETLDSLLAVVTERKKYYGNELTMNEGKALSANQKINALKVFYGVNEKCEYVRYGTIDISSEFIINTYPALLWDDRYQSVVMALLKDASGTYIDLIIDLDKPVDIGKGKALEFELKNGTHVLVRSIKDGKAVEVEKFSTRTWRVNQRYFTGSNELSLLQDPSNPPLKIYIQTNHSRITKPITNPRVVGGLAKCLR